DPDLDAALDLAGGADVVAFDLPAPTGAPRVRAATTVRASPAAIAAALLDPAHFRAVIPSLIRSEVVPGGAQGSRRIAWGLEGPPCTLDGHCELRALAGGGEMPSPGGDLAPGRVIFRAAARPDGRSALQADAVLDVRRSGFFARAVIARSPVGEP